MTALCCFQDPPAYSSCATSCPIRLESWWIKDGLASNSITTPCPLPLDCSALLIQCLSTFYSNHFFFTIKHVHLAFDINYSPCRPKPVAGIEFVSAHLEQMSNVRLLPKSFFTFEHYPTSIFDFTSFLLTMVLLHLLVIRRF